MDVPTWLNSSYVQAVLRKAEKDDSVEVTSMTVKPATAKGDNYTSDMHRITLVLSRISEGRELTETRSLIAKLAPQGGTREEMISEAGFFAVEMSMMSETLPIMQRILTKAGKTATLAARCLHVEYEKPVHLIVEDLAPAGFRMADRQAGLDLDHCLLAIRNLAIFHASSVALVEKDLKIVSKYTRGLFHKDHSSTMVEFFKASTKSLAEEVANWIELSPRISEKISKLSEVVYEKACEVTHLRKDDFNVINHGDFWVNNMLFRYDERQKVVDQIFVDFQICHYGSPATDILYFFGTSPSDEVRIHHRESILREYHHTLTDTMTQLKCTTEPPSFNDLQDVLRKRAFCEAIATFTILPLVLVDKSNVKSLEEMISLNGKYENPACKGKSYRKVMTRLLPLFDSMGLLDLI
ncbi:uncharacterized protein LOC124185048 [Neodiprion fabricii]|uniref:uncharacterized protein LOC124185048 n=1 Tax=Neodiprion fabricii TaxID=2872261 RepID=UPI001ED912AA|nr:uncharacterized protein LOC124185048 [Neodiprion fabricii]XP_046431328.1 uncharacterized protein LOC124185048 [Neodiprion fabricii]XP_046431329.1 uncharacterized protein LOC124185048 [Neodiprion fabricii]XP_046431330.1 uncharacterized protein LOC124185048 [Neodiprion fabricii]